MKLRMVAFVLVAALLMVGATAAPWLIYGPPPPVSADNPPPEVRGTCQGCQPQPDEFQYNGQSLQPYSELSRSIRETGALRWRFMPVSGCNSGSITAAVRAGIGQMLTRWSLDIVEVPSGDASAALTVYGNCGSNFAQVCGGPPVIGCLGRGYPYNNDVDISTDMAAYFDVSQRAIVCHEVCGHALGVWHEQYILGTFASSGDVTIMNTGPLSRHDLGPEEDKRWWRTMGSPEIALSVNGQPNIAYAYAGGWYIWACNFHAKATRLSVLVDLHDGRGVQWSGVIVAKKPNGPGDCQGIGIQQGLNIVVGGAYYLKQENPGSFAVSHNETRVPG